MNIRQMLERSDRPFASHPQVGRFFAAASIEDARLRLGRTIERGDGLGVVIGPAGTGKSLLLQALAAEFHGKFDVVLLACAQLCTRRALLQAILFELGQEYRLRDEGELRLSLLDLLLSGERDSTGLLLLVDEAQLLPLRLLEELRMLTNVVRHGAPRVRLVLAGLPSLEELLASPELESFSQRVVARCYLAPFTREETIQYGRSQIAASAADPDRLVAADAWHAVFEATDGVPRLVNQLCSRALWLADAQNRSQVDRATIQAAWSDLQQLPTPWEGAAEHARAAESREVLEFGGLDDEQPADCGHCGQRHPATEKCAVPKATKNSPAPDQEFVEFAAASLADWPDKSMAPSARASNWTDNWESTIPAAKATAPPRNARQQGPADPHAAVDPFEETFDEEEIVLDSFATWDSAVHRNAPRVENRRDRGFTTLLEQAIVASGAEPVGPRGGRAGDAKCSAADAAKASDCGSKAAERVRLAVVSEPAALRPIPVVTKHDQPTDPAMPAGAADPASAAADKQRAAQSLANRETEILIVEDDQESPVDSEAFAHSEKFRQILARLRGN